MAALLLGHGASVVAADTNGDTPLHQAATPGVARLLLEHHAPSFGGSGLLVAAAARHPVLLGLIRRESSAALCTLEESPNRAP